jgi:hypothetical protein
MIRAGVDRKVAMMISGHKTESVFNRYNITDDLDLEDAIRKTDAYVAQLPKKRETWRELIQQVKKTVFIVMKAFSMKPSQNRHTAHFGTFFCVKFRCPSSILKAVLLLQNLWFISDELLVATGGIEPPTLGL